MLEDSGLEQAHRLDVLDAGCGTGLCGALVAPFARRLVGVDLSEGMLAHAKDKNVYHALIKAELTDYLRDNNEAFDLIVSADALVYFGDLKGVVAGFAGALRSNGLVVFTLEQALGDSAGVDYRLELHGRYGHGRAYVERLLTFSGLQSKIVESRIAHGGRRAGSGAGDSCGQACVSPGPTARARAIDVAEFLGASRRLERDQQVLDQIVRMLQAA